MNAAQRKGRAIRERDTLTDHCAMLLGESPDPLPAGLLSELLHANDAAARPYFDNAEEYVSYAGDCFYRGEVPYGPEDPEQLRALNNEFPAEARRHFHMSAKELEQFGAPAWLFDEVKPWHDRQKREFLETVDSDSVFARAAVVLFREASQ